MTAHPHVFEDGVFIDGLSTPKSKDIADSNPQPIASPTFSQIENLKI